MIATEARERTEGLGAAEGADMVGLTRYIGAVDLTSPTHRRRPRWFEANPGCLTQMVGPGAVALLALAATALRRRRRGRPSS